MWPGFGSRVTIKRCRRVVVVVDIERVQLLSLVVWGELVIPDRGVEMRVAMRAICMRVKPGGRIVVGAPERPITGSVEFLLAGDELAEIAECDGMAGHRFDVEGASTLGGLPDGVPLPGGEVAMYGDTMEGPMWSKLRATAAAGDRTLILAGRLAFHPDDEVVIGTTAMDGSETELRTVASVRYLPVSNGFDTELTLDTELDHDHLGVSETHESHTLEMRAEVGLYNRGHDGAPARAAPAGFRPSASPATT